MKMRGLFGRTKPRSAVASPHIPSSDVIDTATASMGGFRPSPPAPDQSEYRYRTPHSRRARAQSLLRAVGLMVLGAVLISIAGDGWMPAAMQSYHASHASHEAALLAHAAARDDPDGPQRRHRSSFGGGDVHLGGGASAAGRPRGGDDSGAGGGSRPTDVLSLRKALKEAMIARPPALAAALNAYARRHREVLSSKAAADKADYVVYVSGGNDGYGNRLPGVAMALVWALLTDRVLVVHWQDSFPQPVAWGQLFAPGADAHGEGGLELDSAQLLTQLAPLRGHISGGSAGCKARGTSSSCVAVGREAYKTLASKHLGKAFPEQVVLFKSDDFSMPLLTNNPNHRDAVMRLMGGSTGNVFGHVARWLLQPAVPVQATVDRTRQAVEGAGRFAFGLHLRMQKPMPAGGQKGVKVPDPEVFFKVALMRMNALGVPPDQAVFYLASDDARARRAAQEFFTPRGLKVKWMEGVTFGKDGDRTSVAALQNAIAEMRVLSLCDELVGSYGSSFSAVAASWGAIERYDVRADGSYWQSGMTEPCWRFASRGHGEAVADSPDLPYHQGCHEGLSTFKGWQQSDWNKQGRGLA